MHLKEASKCELNTGWTLTSIAGFSGAFSRVLERSLASRAAHGSSRALQGHFDAQALPSRGLSNGMYGLVGIVSSGVTGIVYAPYQGKQQV